MRPIPVFVPKEAAAKARVKASARRKLRLQIMSYSFYREVVAVNTILGGPLSAPSYRVPRLPFVRPLASAGGGILVVPLDAPQIVVPSLLLDHSDCTVGGFAHGINTIVVLRRVALG